MSIIKKEREIIMLEKLSKLIECEMDIDAKTITPATRIIEDLGADSLDAVELIMTLEDEFNVTINDDAAQNFKTVGDILEFLENNR